MTGEGESVDGEDREGILKGVMLNSRVEVGQRERLSM